MATGLRRRLPGSSLPGWTWSPPRRMRVCCLGCPHSLSERGPRISGGVALAQPSRTGRPTASCRVGVVTVRGPWRAPNRMVAQCAELRLAVVRLLPNKETCGKFPCSKSCFKQRHLFQHRETSFFQTRKLVKWSMFTQVGSESVTSLYITTRKVLSHGKFMLQLKDSGVQDPASVAREFSLRSSASASNPFAARCLASLFA